MENELTAALRNALERGESIEKAAKSLINAGYNPAAVKQALEGLTRGVASTISVPQNIQTEDIPVPLQQPRMQEIKLEGKKSAGKGIIITIIILLILIALGLGALFFFYRESLIEYILGLFE